jgi:hypothetical protein
MRLDADKNVGHVGLGFHVKRDAARLELDYKHRLVRGDIDLSAFATAYAGGIRSPGSGWEFDYGAMGGLRLSW